MTSMTIEADQNPNFPASPHPHSLPTAPWEAIPDNQILHDPVFLELVQTMFASMPPERQMQVKRLGQQNYEYVRSSRDKLLTKITDRLCNNAASALFGGSEKRRAVFVVGESDSGKTRALQELVAGREEFKPRRTSAGWAKTFVHWDAPKPLTMKGFALKGLAACGYAVEENARYTERELFELLKEQIREKRIIFMWIDEMQHVLNAKTEAEIQNVSDIIKSLLQIPGWPLHMILSGVPTLANFLAPEDGDRQLRNRSYLVHLGKMKASNSDMMLKLQNRIMKKAGVQMGETDTPSFMERLTYASFGAFGTMVKRMQAAASEALFEAEIAMGGANSRDVTAPVVVGLNHYAGVYELETGSTKAQNIFLAGETEWKNISPLAAIDDIRDGLPKPKEGRRQQKKGGR
ncbi:AAA family ATPase [Rhizobium leguminosarum bv. viciae]|nr:AAA family ATPase [Rhizobium leguminosarum bv. viciae]